MTKKKKRQASPMVLFYFCCLDFSFIIWYMLVFMWLLCSIKIRELKNYFIASSITGAESMVLCSISHKGRYQCLIVIARSNQPKLGTGKRSWESEGGWCNADLISNSAHWSIKIWDIISYIQSAQRHEQGPLLISTFLPNTKHKFEFSLNLEKVNNEEGS